LEENANEFFNGIDKAMAMIPKIGSSGEFPCPVCKTGMVKWVRVSHNKHIRLGCNTPECIMMMQ
jgi:hypothetical protein